MYVPRLRSAAILFAASLGLGACTTYDDGYYDRGYSRVSVGYSSGGYCDPHYENCYRGRGYSPAYYGWYNDFYYPGVGIYVYDQGGRRHRWNDNHRRYWEGRRGSDYREDRRELRENWQDFRQERRGDRRDFREERRDDRRAVRSGEVTRDQFRDDRREDRRDYRRDRRGDRRDLRRANRRDRRN